MKTSPRNPFFLSFLLVGFGSMGTSQASAQTFTTLRSFTAEPLSGPYTNADGAKPSSELFLSGNRLYGTTALGGRSANGTVFGLNIDGTALTNLHSFSATSGSFPDIENIDGANPYAGLILSSNTLYGTTEFGGTNGNGTVFAVNNDGTGFHILHTFTTVSGTINGDGANPYAGLILSSNTLYGATVNGGVHGYGTVFAVNTDGTSFTNLHSFFDLHDGANPFGGLILSGNRLYGTTIGGGIYGDGTVFAVSTGGTGFTNLHFFNLKDGANPLTGLILSSNTLYGTTQGGGTNGNGTVFAVNTDGTGFANLHSFNQSDGSAPQARLILSGNTLYGTTTYGGSAAHGTVFAINTDGTGFATLHGFTSTAGSQGGYGTNSDGGYPVGGLILSSNTLYGTTHIGGSSGNGTVFGLSLPPPQLTVTRSGADLNLKWPTNAIGFILQCTTNFSSAWTTNLSLPVVVDGQYTVTNLISGTPHFYRLSQ